MPPGHSPDPGTPALVPRNAATVRHNGAPSPQGRHRWLSISRSTKQASAFRRRSTRRRPRVPGNPALGRGRRHSVWFLFGVLLLLTVALRLPAFFVEVFNSDETFLATQAEVINEGGRLYEDATDRKPPLVPYLYAATFSVLGTSALWSVRVIAMLAVALTALLLALEAQAPLRRARPRGSRG